MLTHVLFQYFGIAFLSTELLPDDFHARGKREDELQYIAIIEKECNAEKELNDDI